MAALREACWPGQDQDSGGGQCLGPRMVGEGWRWLLLLRWGVAQRGPGTPARGGSGAPRRGPCPSKVDPRLLPPTSEPRLATALLGEPWRGLGQGHPPV